MKVVYSKNSKAIRITEERIRHIYEGHPEMIGQEDNIISTLESPDVILKGDFGELLSCRLFEKTPVTELKYLVAVYKEESDDSGFLLTAYYTRKLSLRREILWKL